MVAHLGQLAEHGDDPERIRAFAEHWFDVADGHAAERFMDRVVVPALAGQRVH